MSIRDTRPSRRREIEAVATGCVRGPCTDGAQRWPAGYECRQAELQGLWQLRQGVLAIGLAADDHRPQYLALPGDWIGVETLSGGPAPDWAWVMADARIEPAALVEARAHRRFLATAYAQARRQAREFLQLRSGSLTDRVRNLLLMLGASQGEHMDVELPSLRQLSALLDATPEAICRVLSGLRQLDVLVPQPRKHTHVARSTLHNLVVPPGLSSGLGSRRRARSVA